MSECRPYSKLGTSCIDHGRSVWECLEAAEARAREAEIDIRSAHTKLDFFSQAVRPTTNVYDCLPNTRDGKHMTITERLEWLTEAEREWHAKFREERAALEKAEALTGEAEVAFDEAGVLRELPAVECEAATIPPTLLTLADRVRTLVANMMMARAICEKEHAAREKAETALRKFGAHAKSCLWCVGVACECGLAAALDSVRKEER